MQAWVLAPDIEQCPAKNRVMSDKSCFTTETVVRCEVKKLFYTDVFAALDFFMNILIDNLLMQFFHIPNRTMWSSKKILYLYFVGFFCPAWDSFSSQNILYIIT